jgi:hypothetical protein
VEGQVFHLPVFQVSARELVQRYATASGREVVPRAIPAWVIRALAPLPGLLGELSETLYQWDRPFLVDDRRFRMRFPGLAASWGDVLTGQREAERQTSAMSFL